jgi:hypothetical protein
VICDGWMDAGRAIFVNLAAGGTALQQRLIPTGAAPDAVQIDAYKAEFFLPSSEADGSKCDEGVLASACAYSNAQSGRSFSWSLAALVSPWPGSVFPLAPR